MPRTRLHYASAKAFLHGAEIMKLHLITLIQDRTKRIYLMVTSLYHFELLSQQQLRWVLDNTFQNEEIFCGVSRKYICLF